MPPTVEKEVDLGETPIRAYGSTEATDSKHPKLWVVRTSPDARQTLGIIDPSSSDVVNQIELPFDGGSVSRLAMTSKSGWLTGTIDARPTLLRLDPTSGETVARQELPFADGTIVEVAATDDAVWVVGSASAATGKPALIRLAPTSLEPAPEVPLAIQTPDDVAIVGAEVLITSYTVADKDLIDGVLSNYNPFSQSFETIRLEDPANSISVGPTDTWLGSWTSLESTGAASKLDATRTGIEKRIEIAEPVQGAATDEAGGVWLTTSRLGPSILANPSETRFRLIHLDSDGAKDQELELKGGRASIELVGDEAWILVTTFHSAEEAIAESTSYRLVVADVA